MNQWHTSCIFVSGRGISCTAGGQAMKPLVTDALWERCCRFTFRSRGPAILRSACSRCSRIRASRRSRERPANRHVKTTRRCSRATSWRRPTTPVPPCATPMRGKLIKLGDRRLMPLSHPLVLRRHRAGVDAAGRRGADPVTGRSTHHRVREKVIRWWPRGPGCSAAVYRAATG
jgi:hypothetical protein